MRFLFFFYGPGAPRHLHSFPTRRSSDLPRRPGRCAGRPARGEEPTRRRDARERAVRSEEHTFELQSPVHLVCRLLLEKKKKHKDSLPPHTPRHTAARRGTATTQQSVPHR